MEFSLPWEYPVCSKCFQNNPYSIWLVKYVCFEPHCHQNEDKKTVVVDRERMKLVGVRPLPANCFRFWGKFWMCKDIGRCRKDHSYAHSQVEFDSWNLKKTIRRECSKTAEAIHKMFPDGPTASSEVCQECLEANPNAIWLTWLKCIHPDEHRDSNIVTVVASSVGGSGYRLVRVRTQISHLRDVDFDQVVLCKFISNPCRRKDTCNFAHSIEELNYWRWQRIRETLSSELTDILGGSTYEELCYKYEYPDDQSVLESRVCEPLSQANYKNKYHLLVYLDDVEHARKMVKECDGDVVLRLVGNQVQITDMENGSAAMDYAIQNHATVNLTIRNGQKEFLFTSSSISRDWERDSLVVKGNVERLISQFQYSTELSVAAHFEIKHWYFWRLHCAIDRMDDCLVSRLVEPNIYKRGFKRHVVLDSPFELDEEYQRVALVQMLSCKPGPPYLVLGPFGTGKTHLLAAAVAELIKDSQSPAHVLVCTHQNTGADNLYRCLQKTLRRQYVAQHVLRIVPDDKIRQRSSLIFGHPSSCKSVHQVKAQMLARWKVIVTTFLTALAIKDKQIKEKNALSFTHIIIDEGAQSREPEALGALVNAVPSTRIIIAGDNQQVGPQVAVYSHLARENGLGTSILERLFTFYKSKRVNKSHVSTLLTNYRCHPSILMLASSLFYECTLLSRCEVKTLPDAPFPLAFECSSLSQEIAATSQAVNKPEAEILVKRMMNLILKAQTNLKIGLLASTRQQNSYLKSQFHRECSKQNLKPKELPQGCEVETLPTFIIQGEEFDAVFLSTFEPTDENGKPRDPVRSVCNRYVFNTIITRARSLIYAIGNPFLLLNMGAHFDPKFNCWKEYIQRCITCESLVLPKVKNEPDLLNRLSEIIQQLSLRVLPLHMLEKASELDLEDDENDIADAVLQQYMKVFHSREEQGLAIKLVQDPNGIKSWEQDTEDEEGRVILVELNFTSYRSGVAIPEDPSEPEIKFNQLSSRKGGFQGDKVLYDVDNKRILFDEEMEKAFNETHFASSFLCRVNPRSSIEFYPLDNRYPKFINLPTLTKSEKNGVVCFDPASINTCPRMNNFIPMDVALKMTFVVKFLRWRKRHPYPLGIIVGALPQGNSLYTGDLLLKISHSIPLVDTQPQQCQTPCLTIQNTNHVYHNAITIDPENSFDHDDALHCKLISRSGDTCEYEVGVHITDVQKFVPKGSDEDDVALKRGCSVYSSSDHCVSHMLPRAIVEAASLSQGKRRDAFSIVANMVQKDGVVKRLKFVRIEPSQVTTSTELTYQQAQAVIYRRNKSDPIYILWQAASFLRHNRLGDSAGFLSANDGDDELSPEAHILVEEFMIWANQAVASMLMKWFPDTTILRKQPKPPEVQVRDLVKSQGHNMAMSLSLRQRVLPNQRSFGSVEVLNSTLQAIKCHLSTGNITGALHCIQFEHLHPQIAVAHSLFNQIRSLSTYCIRHSLQEGETYSHDGLRCEEYTRFTSPIRRFVDLVTQRSLNAIFVGQDNPYSVEELETICKKAKETEQRANWYESDMKKLLLACQLRNIGKESICFVTEVKEARMHLKFTVDRDLKKIHPAIHLKDLSASHIPSKSSKLNETTTATQNCTWQVKYASLHGTPEQFLDNDYLQPILDEDEFNKSNRHATISFFIPDKEPSREDGTVKANLVEEKALFAIKPLTHSVSGEKWRALQNCALRSSGNSHPEGTLKDICQVNTVSQDITSPLSQQRCPLWIYRIHRPLESCEVLQAQLTASPSSFTHTLTPTVQLLEVGPNLQICVQHNTNPAYSFTDKPSEKISKTGYRNIEEYFNFWEQVILAEAATASISETDLLIIRDLKLKWPKLVMQIDSQGQVYYQLPVNLKDPVQGCVYVNFPRDFANSSYNFFSFAAGDLVCVRCVVADDDEVRCVFHMVVHTVDRRFDENQNLLEIDVLLKFVGQSSNYISPAVAKAIENPRASSIDYEIQLIPLNLPHRRIYKCLCELKGNGKQLAHDVALGRAKTTSQNPPSVHRVFPPGQADIATRLWKPDLSGVVPLNPFQKKAVELACWNKYVMIQGPPGTGKSVTGAHIAYALAMKLKRERARFRITPKDPYPCVMYCGPSQQSVNVVLDILISCEEVIRDVNILRVFSGTIEKKDFTGPDYHSEVFRKGTTDTECSSRFTEYALHHKVRCIKPNILEMEKRFKELQRQGKLPSASLRRTYKSMVGKAETHVLKSENIDIILCTCNEASSTRISENVKPVYCIIDECAMATEPECMVPIRLAENVVLIGDHNQLQPVLKNNDAKEMGMGISLFERYVSSTTVKPHMLETQYRMHDSICEFASEEFYDRKLTTHGSVKVCYREKISKLARFWPRGTAHPIAFCDVVGTENEDHTGQKGTTKVGMESKHNQREAKKIADIASRLIETYKIAPEEIAALTPYSSQREEIKRQLRKKNVEGVAVKTITDSQGSEFGIVLLSTVRSKNLKDITTTSGRLMKADSGWLRANLGFITDRHQICVATTRCKYGLAIVGNKTLLSYDKTWRKLINHYYRKRCVVEERQWP